MDKRKLKIGILLDSFDVSAWSYRSIERVVNSGCAEISVIIVNDVRRDVYKSKLEGLWKNRDKAFYYLLNKIDRHFFRKKPDAFEVKDVREILSGVPTIRVNPVQEKGADYFAPHDIDEVRRYDLDILVKMGFGVLRGDVLTSSKHGAWSYHHGDNRVNSGGPPGFWASIESWPEMGSTLRVLSENPDGGKVLYRSWSPTNKLSPYRNRNGYYWTSSFFLARQIKCLYDLGEERFFQEIERFNQEPDFSSGLPDKTPSNLAALRALAIYLSKMAFECLRKVCYRDQWYLLFDLGPGASKALGEFKEIVPPKDRFWADPHVIQADGKFYIFIEEYLYKARKAHISVIEMDREGNYKAPVRVLERRYHLSYPVVFELEGTYHMIPESERNRTIELYECIEFPYEWRFKMNLMEGVRAVDTTPFFHNGKWWLFANMSENEGSLVYDELFLFYSDRLATRQWTPHPLNPIVSDVKSARPAGPIFARDGRIFRPSQDCSVRYGHGININEILLLSETEYLEKKTASITPSWSRRVKATHSFATAGELTVIDASRLRRRIL